MRGPAPSPSPLPPVTATGQSLRRQRVTAASAGGDGRRGRRRRRPPPGTPPQRTAVPDSRAATTRPARTGWRASGPTPSTVPIPPATRIRPLPASERCSPGAARVSTPPPPKGSTGEGLRARCVGVPAAWGTQRSGTGRDLRYRVHSGERGMHKGRPLGGAVLPPLHAGKASRSLPLLTFCCGTTRAAVPSPPPSPL